MTGPYIEPFWTQGWILDATAVAPFYVQTVAFFPQVPNPPNFQDPIDRRAITAQTWTVAWEGPLSGVRNSGHPLASDLGLMSFPGGGATGLKTDSLFQDGGVNYCATGVVPGDLVTLTGCTDNTQCGLGEQCVFGDGVSSAAAGLAVTGICVDPNRSVPRRRCARTSSTAYDAMRWSRPLRTAWSSGRTSTRLFCRRSRLVTPTFRPWERRRRIRTAAPTP